MSQNYTLQERHAMRATAAELRAAARIAQLSGLHVKATDLMVAAIDLEDGADKEPVYLVPVDPADETICEACS